MFYDGACPLCRREINLYRNLAPERPVTFLDVSAATTDVPPADRRALLERFHVRHSDGRMESGAKAFLSLWALFPGWRWLARAGSLPGAPGVLEAAYRVFLRIRPALQRLAARVSARP